MKVVYMYCTDYMYMYMYMYTYMYMYMYMYIAVVKSTLPTDVEVHTCAVRRYNEHLIPSPDLHTIRTPETRTPHNTYHKPNFDCKKLLNIVN